MQRPDYPHHMPDAARDRLDRVEDPQLVALLIDLWHAAQDYECDLAAGKDGFERHIKRQQAQQDAVFRKGQFDAAVEGKLGPVAKDLAKQCHAQMVHGTTQDALYRDFEKAWAAEQRDRASKRQAEREKRAAAAAQRDLYEEAG